MPGVQSSRLQLFPRGLCAGLLAALASGCVDQAALVKAAEDVSDAFRIEYERILKERGTRVYPRRRDDAIYRLRSAALERLEMKIESYDLDLGYVRFSAPAPRPLTFSEWGEVAQVDLPKMRAIVGKHVGWLKWLIPFEPEGLDIVINATVISVSGGSEVTLSMRMREIKPPPSGMPRREYPPPTAVEKGLDKIWAAVDAEMEVRARSP